MKSENIDCDVIEYAISWGLFLFLFLHFPLRLLKMWDVNSKGAFRTHFQLAEIDC